LSDAAEIEKGSPASFAIVQARCDKIIDPAVDVIAQFASEIAFHAAAPEAE
jgi:hypothetical protein